MNEEDVIDEIINTYGEWIEMLCPTDADHFVIDQLCRRVASARREVERYKSALKRLEMMK